jgi:hypothetical protein
MTNDEFQRETQTLPESTTPGCSIRHSSFIIPP